MENFSQDSHFGPRKLIGSWASMFQVSCSLRRVVMEDSIVYPTKEHQTSTTQSCRQSPSSVVSSLEWQAEAGHPKFKVSNH